MSVQQQISEETNLVVNDNELQQALMKSLLVELVRSSNSCRVQTHSALVIDHRACETSPANWIFHPFS
jgi:hypothetical protein